MATDAEASELFKLLSENLAQHSRPEEKAAGFPTGIDAEIQAGRQVKVKLTVPADQRTDDALAGPRVTQSTTRAEFVQRRDLTGKEKLDILLDGIGLARVAPPRMASKILETIGAISPRSKLENVSFADDLSSDPRLSFGPQEVATAVEAVGELQRLLNVARSELGASIEPMSEA